VNEFTFCSIDSIHERIVTRIVFGSLGKSRVYGLKRTVEEVFLYVLIPRQLLAGVSPLPKLASAYFWNKPFAEASNLRV
jgi:hypothetical protein